MIFKSTIAQMELKSLQLYRQWNGEKDIYIYRLREREIEIERDRKIEREGEIER